MLGVDESNNVSVPCVLVGVCSEHLNSHQNWLALADVKGELLMHELLHALCLTQMHLRREERREEQIIQITVKKINIY